MGFTIMTIANYVRAGIVGLALLGCKERRTHPEQYDTRCIAVYADSSMKLCTDRSKGGTLITLYDPNGSICFSKPGDTETRCGAVRNLALTPELEEATNRALTGMRDLSYSVDKAVREQK